MPWGCWQCLSHKKSQTICSIRSFFYFDISPRCLGVGPKCGIWLKRAHKGTFKRDFQGNFKSNFKGNIKGDFKLDFERDFKGNLSARGTL